MTTIPQNDVPLVEAKNIKKYFPVRAHLVAKLLVGQKDHVIKAVDDVSLKIWSGETVGLVGESGCGKTTLGRVVTKLHKPTEGQLLFRNYSVEVWNNGAKEHILDESRVTHTQDKLSQVAEAEVHHLSFFRFAQIIFQNPYSSLNPRKTVRDIIGVALRQRGITDAQLRETETRQLLHRVGLNEAYIDSYPHQFSGGQRQRIGIARVLAIRPQFIVADEPVSALDVSIQAQIINLLEELQEEYHLTYLFIAHDLSLIYHMSDRTAVMYLGHIVEEADTQSLFNNPLHPYTQALLAAIPKMDRASRQKRIILEGMPPSPLNPPRGCPFHPRCFAKKGPECENEYPPEVEVQGHKVACWLHI